MDEFSRVEYCFLWIDWWPLCLSKPDWAAWTQAVGSVAAIVAAWIIPVELERRRRAEVLNSHWETIALDIRYAELQGAVYLRGKVRSPAYRLPLVGKERALHAVLAEAKLEAAEAQSLLQFYVDATSFNLCLDIAMQLRMEGGNWENEAPRITKKATHLVPRGGKSSRDRAWSLVAKRLSGEAARRLLAVQVSEEEED